MFRLNGFSSSLILLESFENLALLITRSSLKPGFPEKMFLILFQNPLALFLSLAPLSQPFPEMPSSVLSVLFSHSLGFPSSSALHSGPQLPLASCVPSHPLLLCPCLFQSFGYLRRFLNKTRPFPGSLPSSLLPNLPFLVSYHLPSDPGGRTSGSSCLDSKSWNLLILHIF